MFITLARDSITFEIKFQKKTPRTKFNRLIREMNDLCLCCYRESGKPVDNWIILSSETMNNISGTLYVNYASFFFMIKSMRTIAIRNCEIINNIRNALDLTNRTLRILDTAASSGYIINYKTIKRKYLCRRNNQSKKIYNNIKKFNFVCSIRFFYWTIIQEISRWSIGPTSNDQYLNQDTKNIFDESELNVTEELINHTIESLEIKLDQDLISSQ